MSRHVLAGAMSLAALILNPGFGCEPEFEFGPDEMRRLAEGTWRMSQAEQSSNPVTFTLEYATDPMTSSQLIQVQRAACVTRSFVADAGACVTTSTIHLTGQVLSGPVEYLGVRVSGNFRVSGYSIDGGALYVAFSNGSSLRGALDKDGNVIRANLIRDQAQSEVSLVRL